MSHSMLHVHCGLLIYVGTIFLLGERRGSWIPVTAVLSLELMNEVMDRLYYGSWRLDDTGLDVVSTMFWPVVLVTFSRYRRAIWHSRHNRHPSRSAHPSTGNAVWMTPSASRHEYA